MCVQGLDLMINEEVERFDVEWQRLLALYRGEKEQDSKITAFLTSHLEKVRWCRVVPPSVWVLIK